MAALLPFALETYRSSDPIENLALRVTLRKRGTQGERILDNVEGEASTAPSTAAAALKKKKDRRSRAEASTPRSGDDGSDDEDAAASQPLAGEKEEEEKLECPPRVFRWQEKRFSPMDVYAVRRQEQEERSKNGTSRAGSFSFRSASSKSIGSSKHNLSNHHREVLRKLDSEAADNGAEYMGDVLFSRVHSEGWVDPRDASTKLTDSSFEVATPLAKSVVEGRFVREHRDVLGEAAHVTMHIFAALPAEAVGDADDTHDRGDKPSATSFLRRRASASADGEPRRVEVLLCVLRLYPGGRLDIKPPLSLESRAAAADTAAAAAVAAGGLAAAAAGGVEEERVARWYAVPGTRYEYLLESLVGGGDAHEAIANRVAKLSQSAQSAIGRGGLPAELGAIGDFSAPPRKHARVHYLIEIESARGFGPNPLYIAYYALAANGWTLAPSCLATAVTQTSKVRGEDERAVFGFPIELTVESDGPPTAARPPLSLFLSIVSRDAHERLSLLGYALCSPPAVAGSTVEDVGAWRLAESRSDALRRFFVGGTEELQDLRALGLPAAFDSSQASCLNKHGLQTVTTGSVRLRLNTIVQQHQPPRPTTAAMLARQRATDGPRAQQFGRPPPSMGSLKGVLNVSTLARTETAADRVKKRLEERRRAEGAA